MKTWLAFSTSAFLFGALAGAQIASADSATATCEVRKDGEKQGGKSGPCTFGQRQGYVDIDLRNGDTYSLSPGNNANNYRDQKGNKVVRTRSTANSQEFRWDNGKYVTVHFNASNHNSSGYNPGYGAGAYGNGGQSSEYQRGFKDGQRGNWDQNKHNQEYKDGYRAGEQAAGGGNGGGNSADSSYYINPLTNGGFEVVWKNSCVASYSRQGDPLGYSNDCKNDQTYRSDEIAKRHR
ncbi:MAG: hypothetical protein RL261_1195 [Pseudomonadota bacterium]